jgi:hypothetical protein
VKSVMRLIVWITSKRCCYEDKGVYVTIMRDGLFTSKRHARRQCSYAQLLIIACDVEDLAAADQDTSRNAKT